MAGSIVTIGTSIAWSQGSLTLRGTVTNRSVQVGDAAIENVQLITNVSEAVLFGDVADPAYIMFVNENDDDPEIVPTRYIYVGTTNPCTAVNAIYKLPPGQGVALVSNIAAWYCIAAEAVANQRLAVIAIER